MKKNLLFLLLTTIVVCSSNAQTQKVNLIGGPDTPSFVPLHEGPYIEFEKTIHDYGQISYGADGSCEFKFKNTGSEPLILLDVQTSCGCTAPSWSREPVMPGQESVIKIQYDTTKEGSISTTATVFSNSVGDKKERIVLRLNGIVNPK